jgi:hypothetical protein
MEPLNILILVVSCAISFGIGRVIVHFRNKRRLDAARQALADRPPVIYDEAQTGDIKNKSKRKRLQRESVKNRAR